MHFIHDRMMIGILDNLKDILRHEWFYHSNCIASCVNLNQS